ncbi:MAG TPA: diaminopimelate decarboxylase, partial [Aquifex aeolicus]|nr:diaminopimelate decarboxylase [Aquifex aeolicus]
MKKDYEKPVINRINLGLANKVGGKAFYSSRVRDNIDGVPIEKLVDKFGTPL